MANCALGRMTNPVSALPFFAGAQAVTRQRTVDCQHRIQMIHLMLQQLSQRPFGLQMRLSAPFIKIGQAHGDGAFQPYQKLRE